MALSALMLKVKYHVEQIIAASIVCASVIITVLAATTRSRARPWALVLILSTFPMVLSSVYKEIGLGDTDLGPIYLNAWIALFHFVFSILLAIDPGGARHQLAGLPERAAEQVYL
jgi:hypothetical protein